MNSTAPIETNKTPHSSFKFLASRLRHYFREPVVLGAMEKSSDTILYAQRIRPRHLLSLSKTFLKWTQSWQDATIFPNRAIAHLYRNQLPHNRKLDRTNWSHFTYPAEDDGVPPPTPGAAP